MIPSFTLRCALQQAFQRLSAEHATARLDAELLLAQALGKTRAYLHTWPTLELEEEQFDRFQALIERRAHGEPIAYITGRREFWSLEFQVTPDTLIPRPETELLVERALEIIPEHAAWRIADLGTGCGAIALALAHERPACTIVATDIAPQALAIARANAARLNLRNIEFRAGSADWLGALRAERYALIVSNPPYVRRCDPYLTQGDLRFEPPLALEAGADGGEHLHTIAAAARTCLLPGGSVLLEHGHDQGAELLGLLQELGYVNVTDYCDLAGQARVTGAQYSP